MNEFIEDIIKYGNTPFMPEVTAKLECRIADGKIGWQKIVIEYNSGMTFSCYAMKGD